MRSWAGRDITQRVEVGGAQFAPSTQGATMLADLDLLLIAVFCAADDFLPVRARNARRMVTDAEVVTLAVAQAIMGGAARRHWFTEPPSDRAATGADVLAFRAAPGRSRGRPARRP